jgi:(E)-4-hydroxy-3-methylbut-2-enyl-diphosphate synthase
MQDEFGVLYPLHLGVTEAGDGEDGRIKSAIGIGTLMEDGIGDTIRVSLTEDPEFEIPVCRDLVKRYEHRSFGHTHSEKGVVVPLPYSPFEYRRRATYSVGNVGDHHVPVVVADFMKSSSIAPGDLKSAGYHYNESLDKWNIGDAAADFIYTGDKRPEFAMPGSLQVLCNYDAWLSAPDKQKFHPVIGAGEYLNLPVVDDCYIMLDCNDISLAMRLTEKIKDRKNVVLCVRSSAACPMPAVRDFITGLMTQKIQPPIILVVESRDATIDEQLIHFSAEAGALLLDGMGDGIWLMNDPSRVVNKKISGRTYLEATNNHQFINNTSFSILQATRTRISKTEYISCPSCGRTLFDLQETTAKIRSVTNHLKGVKIAIMGCIVNGPGEMADADFGYVGSGPGKITLYKGKEVVKRAVNSDIAVEELVSLLKENGAWVDPA